MIAAKRLTFERRSHSLPRIYAFGSLLRPQACAARSETVTFAWEHDYFTVKYPESPR